MNLGGCCCPGCGCLAVRSDQAGPLVMACFQQNCAGVTKNCHLDVQAATLAPHDELQNAHGCCKEQPYFRNLVVFSNNSTADLGLETGARWVCLAGGLLVCAAALELERCITNVSVWGVGCHHLCLQELSWCCIRRASCAANRLTSCHAGECLQLASFSCGGCGGGCRLGSALSSKVCAQSLALSLRR